MFSTMMQAERLPEYIVQRYYFLFISANPWPKINAPILISILLTSSGFKPNVSDKIDAEIVEDVDDAPEKVLAS